MSKHPLRIGIIGSGFSGTTLATLFARQSQQPLEIFLFEQTGKFGTGDAYRTTYPFHLLNVRAKDMSAFENEPNHFTEWLMQHHASNPHLEKGAALAEIFAPRYLYSEYLNDELNKLASQPKIKLIKIAARVVKCELQANTLTLFTHINEKIELDKAILAIGNNPPADLPFPVDSSVKIIANSWDYPAIQGIANKEDVLIIGTGLSMIDAVLTLHHQHHQGKIYVLSRHGLVPLPHTDTTEKYVLPKELPMSLRKLVKFLHTAGLEYMQAGGDWRAIISALRPLTPTIWLHLSVQDKKRFLRHVHSYWNIHRHRVHAKLAELLNALAKKEQLVLMKGRMQKVSNKTAFVKPRYQKTLTQFHIDSLINCMGPALQITAENQPLIFSLVQQGEAMLDPLGLGLSVFATGALKTHKGLASKFFYTLGPLARSLTWECSAVPEIRKQCFDLVNHILQDV